MLNFFKNFIFFIGCLYDEFFDSENECDED